MNRHRLLQPNDETYPYVSKFMSKEEYMQKLGDVKLIISGEQVKEGHFPDIFLPSTTGKPISIAEIAKDHNVVVFFYPGDKEGLKYPELAGCTPEACSFKNILNEFESRNTKVFGVSFQTSEGQGQFVEAQHLNFPLLSDAEHALSQALNLPYWKSKQDECYPCRQTYLLARGNVISHVFEKVIPDKHIDEVMDKVKQLDASIKLT
jgi:peroxiredoxin Q/BCP